ncbi:serine/threonine-protein kinase [Pseudonocardia xinjiangensis]|uniref:non-specific serine/threonine protein kinase n=1 Tax=Pseudonocardia xinjiangensis TaxID=75289 RepID=A0ABX1R9T7_9PSEU|nr:serine/threonine-protein kinase [Pseudonocardia xinjiangensis]NMH77163.1 protein kinase [Pseudonocardia xinjiangensis]
MPEVDEDRLVPALAERYELGDVLGAGAAATVYRAVDRHSGRSVAVKLFDPQVSRPRRPGHVVEAAALGELRHPALVELYATGVDNGLAYLVMQLVDGGTLSDRIAGGPVPVGTAAAMGARLADALAHVHERGIVHRDLKPGNVLLDADQRPYLADFGVSRLIDATRVTATGFVVGTPAYMAPEQVRGQAVGPPADVYALGLILLEAVTGRREYPGDVVESAVARLHRRPAVPAGLPDGLRSLLSAMTADDPDQRPSAATVAAQLTASAGDTVAGSTGPAPRPLRRSRWLAAAAASAVLTAGALVMTTATGTPSTPRAAAGGASSPALPSSPAPAAPAAPVVVPPLVAAQPATPQVGAVALTAAAPRPSPARSPAATAERAAEGSDARRLREDRSGSTPPAGRSDPDTDRPRPVTGGAPAGDGNDGYRSARNNSGATNRQGAENRAAASDHGGGKGGKEGRGDRGK